MLRMQDVSVICDDSHIITSSNSNKKLSFQVSVYLIDISETMHACFNSVAINHGDDKEVLFFLVIYP